MGVASATPVLVEHLLQVRIQEHSSGVQLLADVTELSKGGVHFLKVLPGAIVGLWKQADAVDFVLTELAGYATYRPGPNVSEPYDTAPPPSTHSTDSQTERKGSGK